MSAKLEVYTYIPTRSHASYYYRAFVPLDTCARLGLPIQAKVDSDLAGIPSEWRAQAFFESDVVLLYQPIGEHTWMNVKSAKSILPSKRDQGWKYPPSIIVDTDDNLFDVSPYNIAFKNLGWRIDGKEIPKGEMIGDVRDGKRQVLWRDGEEGFDVMKNRNNLATYRQMIEAADCVTGTTPRVLGYLGDNATPSRTEVFPNLVRFDHYEQVDLRDDPKQIKILWQGGASHYEDWLPLKDALAEITEKYKEIHWIIWGQLYGWIAEAIPADRYTFKDWNDYSEYKLRLAMLGHDINLAPLNDNKFNRSRSAIKFYESSVLRKPAATLAQRTGPYADEIVEGETGLLFADPKEFVEKLSTLIENPHTTRTLASNAKDWLSQERDAFKHVPRWAQFIEELRETEKLSQPHMPEDEWLKFVAEVEEQQRQAEQAQEPEPALAG